MNNLPDVLEREPEPSSYFVGDGMGGYIFTDPLSGRQLAQEPPLVLDYDYMSVAGREHIALTRPTWHVVAGHHAGPEDFGDILNEHGDVLTKAKVIGIEADWQAPDNLAELDPTALPVLISDGQRGQFTQAQIAWARKHDKLVVPFDLDGPDDLLRRSLLRLWRRDGVEAGVTRQTDPQRYNQLGHICLGAYMAMRQRMLPLQLGFMLRRLTDLQRITPDDTVVAILGKGHAAALPPILRSLGVQPVPHVVRRRTRSTPADEQAYQPIFEDMTLRAGVTAEVLARPFPFD